MTEPRRQTLEIDGACLTTSTWGSDAPEIILLHDGLGSIAQWRAVPGEVARRTGRTVLAYDRAGHGESTPTPRGPWPTEWLHHEARTLEALICAVGADRPTLVGHSDGGTIALIHAANTGRPQGVVLLAAHTWVEEAAVSEIASLRTNPAPVIAGLGRHHNAPDALFDAWSGVWTSDDFGRWDIRPMLAELSTPVLVVQGTDDEYATQAQATETTAAIGASAQCLLLPDRGHLLHHQDPERVVTLISDFVGAT